MEQKKPKNPKIKKKRISADKLEFREITRDAAPKVKQLLIAKEAVHPFTEDDKIAELDRRLAPADAEGIWDKHCFGVFAPGSSTPEMAIFVQYAHITPDKDGIVPSNKLIGKIGAILSSDGQVIEKPNAAFFYTITNAALMADGRVDPTHPIEVRPTKSGQKGADILIHRLVEHLAAQGIKEVDSTLSPMRRGKEDKARGFATWLKRMEKEEQPIFTQKEKETLCTIAGLSPGANPYVALSQCITNRANLSAEDQKYLETVMIDLGIYYLVHEKKPESKPRQQKFWSKKGLQDFTKELFFGRKAKVQKESVPIPLDDVAELHIGKGAEVAKLHPLKPEESTPSDMIGALGIMVNYRYYPENLAKRKANYEESHIVRLSPELAERHYAREQQLKSEQQKPEQLDKSELPCDFEGVSTARLSPLKEEHQSIELIMPTPKTRVALPAAAVKSSAPAVKPSTPNLLASGKLKDFIALQQQGVAAGPSPHQTIAKIRRDGEDKPRVAQLTHVPPHDDVERPRYLH